MDGNEESHGFVRGLYERIRDWEFRHLWIARLCVYLVLLMVVSGVCHCAFTYFGLCHTDADSARYMLSAMVQAQAAIVAIVITLTLIAVQLTASAYSPRVIDVFKKNPDMWLLFGFYGLSMLYGLVVLKMVEGVTVSQDIIWSLGCVSISFESCVSFAYWLEAFTLVALVLHMLDIISLLKPENIIKRLAIKITKDKILNPEKDPIQPIMDIIHGAVMKYDIATTRIGLEAVMDHVIKIIDSDSQEKISRHFCDHLRHVSELTVSKMDERSTIMIIEKLYNFEAFAAERGLEYAALETVHPLEHIGKTATKSGLKNTAKQAAESLGYIGTNAAEMGNESVAKQVAYSLGRIGKAATGERIKRASNQTVESLGDVGKAAAENELKDATSEAAFSLGVVGKAAAEKELDDAACEVTKSLREIGMIAAGKGFENATLEVVNSLGAVGIAVAEKGLTNVTFHIAESLGRIGMAAVENELIDAPQRAAKCLAHIGKITAEGGGKFEAVTVQVIESIGAIGKQEGKAFYAGYLMRVGETTVKQKLENETWVVVKSIGQVGMAAAKKRDVAENVIMYLDSYLNTINRSTGDVELAECATKEAAQFLIKIGVFAIEHNLNDAAQEHAKCFVKWTRSYGKLDVLELFSEWATSGRDKSAHKFEEICEELRTRNSN